MWKLIPLPYKIAAVTVATLAVFASGFYFGSQWDESSDLREKLDAEVAKNGAIQQRLTDNLIELGKQLQTNEELRSVKNEELTQVRSALNAERLRVGARSCPATGSAEAASSGGGDGSDTGGRVLSEEMERRIKGLIEETEEVAATGRTCQGFIRKNEMAP